MTEPVVPQPSYDDIQAYHGASEITDFFDLSARRHLMPSVMDDPISSERQCACPGGPVSENSCIDVWTVYTDRLCDMCRLYCYDTDTAGVQHRYIDVYGTTLPDIPSRVVWSPNEKRTRSHAFVEECRGCHGSLAEHTADTSVGVGSICRQAWLKDWQGLSVEVASLPRCKTCSQLMQARETGTEMRSHE